MVAPLLRTKLQVPPPRPDHVPRPRLVQQLDAGFYRKLTLVSAPAGYGKSTLLGEWVAGLSRPMAWLALDAEDGDPTGFWAYVIAALQTCHPHLGEKSVSLLAGPSPLPAATLLTPLLNEISALPEPPGLVLDDYHLIGTPEIHQGIAFLLDHQPAGMHLVIATRADPPLPTSRLRARGQLTELRVRDLRFARDETDGYLRQVMGLDLEPADVAALQARTEGWPAGLQLAGLSLQGRKDPHGFIAGFSGGHHYVLEFLVGEVVGRQSERVRRFLIETSVLDRLSGPLCDAVTGRDDGETLLDDLYRRNLFVIPLDDARRWWRYHHLFADLLGNLLRQERSGDEIRALHQRASLWFEGQGLAGDAIHHALGAGDWERAAVLIEDAARKTMVHGSLSQLGRWLDALPAETVEARLRLQVYRAWALSLSGQTELANAVLRKVDGLLADRPRTDDDRALRGEVAAMLTSIASQHEPPSAVIAQAQEALTYLPLEDRLSRARVSVALATAYAYTDALDMAMEILQEAQDLALEAGNPFLSAAASEMLAGLQIYHLGQLRAAAQSLHQLLARGVTADSRPLPYTGTAHALLAEVYLEQNDLDRAARLLEQGIALIEEGGIAHSRTHVYCTEARLRRALGDPEGVRAALVRARVAVETYPMWHSVVQHATTEARLALWLGDPEEALRWAEGESALSGRLPHYLQEVRQVALAWVALAQGDPARVLAIIDAWRPGAEASGRTAQTIALTLLEALAQDVQGEFDAADAALGACLALAEPAGYVQLFVEAGRPVIPLLRRAVGADRLGDYAGHLLELVSRAAGSEGLTEEPSLVAGLAEPLTPREAEVLRLVCDGLSNRAIAQRLVVSLSTVKKHTGNIYGKLGVNSRTQAIVRAQELGLA
jgi:LuxR family maltose regulon positive regulatory protein